MACPVTLSGLARDCAQVMGGIKTVYLANKADVASITVTSNQITGITMETSKYFHKYDFLKGAASLSSNWQISPENGTRYVQTDLVLVFAKMETTKRVEVSALAAGELCAIVEDNNGTFHFLGADNPLEISAGDGLTGAARGDRNAYSITLQDNSLDLPIDVLVGTGGVDLSTITT